MRGQFPINHGIKSGIGSCGAFLGPLVDGGCFSWSGGGGSESLSLSARGGMGMTVLSGGGGGRGGSRGGMGTKVLSSDGGSGVEGDLVERSGGCP